MLKWALVLIAPLAALEVEPWLGNVWEFRFTPAYTYSRFHKVQNGEPQLHDPYNVHLLALGMGVAPTETSGFDADAEFVDTTKQAMGYRSCAFQYRSEWMDDIVGDWATLTTGISLRGVSRHSLKDISCPYASDLNVELNGALGKEWNRGSVWSVRMFGWGALGKANHGSPWIRFLFSIEGQQEFCHRFGLYLLGYFGFGAKEFVPVNHFHGYATIHHQSVDVGVRYAYVFNIWGNLAVSYARRVYAHAFPESVNAFTVSYTLPFCFF